MVILPHVGNIVRQFLEVERSRMMMMMSALIRVASCDVRITHISTRWNPQQRSATSSQPNYEKYENTKHEREFVNSVVLISWKPTLQNQHVITQVSER